MYAKRLLTSPPQWLPSVYRVLSIIVLSFASYNTSALPQDSQQPINISSGSAIKDDKKGIAIYKGNVNIQQGSLKIKADKVTIYIENETATKIVAVGRPAQFQQKPEANENEVLAKASTIEYRITKEVITLTGNASLDQQGSINMTGNKINYDVKAGRVEAKGSKQTGPITTTIQPKVINPKDTDKKP